jgi:prepilin-type N-terminal cleavage/methylation domain-containing protein
MPLRDLFGKVSWGVTPPAGGNRVNSSRIKTKGFSLIEVMMVIAIAAMALTLGLTGLNKAKTAGNSRGLATAVAAEFRYAREKAIAKGSPVAVVIPRVASRSLFWLEGTTEPVVTRVVNYEGDYPRGAITVATYNGPSYEKNAVMPGFKAMSWADQLDGWLPSTNKDDFVFMFTPNGSVLSNDLPSSGGSYRVVVGTGAEVVPATAPGAGPEWVAGSSVYFDLVASGEPYTVSISLSGAVESQKGLLGWDGTGVNTEGAAEVTAASPPNPEVDYVPVVPDIIHSRITPPAEDVDGEMVHVLDKGEYLTLEVFAQSGDGKPIYASWVDVPVTKLGDAAYKGRFSVPKGAPERMEFYPEFDIHEDGTTVENVWRSVWTWTPPKTAEAGDRYNLNVDVKDAKQTVSATIPDIPPVDVAPPGEIVYERRVGARWHLYTMWADGSRVKRITEGPHNYRCASATADGKILAFERDGSEIWVMNTDGTGETKVANGRLPTISPTGSSIAYMNMANNLVVVKRLDSSSGATASTATARTVVNGSEDPGNRLAYSRDGSWVYFSSPGGTAVMGAHLSFPGNGISIASIHTGTDIPNDPSGSQVGGLFTDRTGQYVYYHGDAADPYLGRYPIAGGPPGTVGTSSGPNVRVSVGQNEFYPAISPDGNLVLFNEVVGGVTQIRSCPMASWKTSGVGTTLTSGLRPAWIRQREGF